MEPLNVTQAATIKRHEAICLFTVTIYSNAFRTAFWGGQILAFSILIILTYLCLSEGFPESLPDATSRAHNLEDNANSLLAIRQEKRERADAIKASIQYAQCTDLEILTNVIAKYAKYPEIKGLIKVKTEIQAQIDARNKERQRLAAIQLEKDKEAQDQINVQKKEEFRKAAIRDISRYAYVSDLKILDDAISRYSDQPDIWILRQRKEHVVKADSLWRNVSMNPSFEGYSEFIRQFPDDPRAPSAISSIVHLKSSETKGPNKSQENNLIVDVSPPSNIASNAPPVFIPQATQDEIGRYNAWESAMRSARDTNRVSVIISLLPQGPLLSLHPPLPQRHMKFIEEFRGGFDSRFQGWMHLGVMPTNAHDLGVLLGRDLNKASNYIDYHRLTAYISTGGRISGYTLRP